ncbi:MAG: hypothetical protein M1496_00085 [Candidatus Thermoplasmatota archaeon]|jgi:uncharacterized membrane protein|nr:hypothetical protein [Candidatus Thermoplasmatota archaeon]
MEGKEIERLQNHYKTLIERFGLYAMGIMILFLPYSIYNLVGYSSTFFLEIEFALSFIGFLFILIGSRRGEYGNRDPRKVVLFSIVSVLIISFLTFLVGMATNFPITDELAIEMLSAKSVLAGHDPYGISFSINAMKALGVPSTFFTPTLVGNYITSIQYPSLSFMIMIPFVVFNIKPEVLLLLFSVFLLSIVPFSFLKNKMDYAAPLATAIAIFNINFILFSFNGITDVVWATFMGLSILFIDKKYLPGIFYGIALSFKQIPLIIFPFLFIYMLKTYGLKRALWFTMITAITFLIFNLPFIILNPHAYFNSVIGPEFSPLLGIGFGISQISFMGIVPYADSNFFAALMISSWFLSIIYYYFSFERNKYTLTAFPILIFLFNYRLLENYLIYWPVLSLIFIPPLFKEKNVSIKKSAFTGLSSRNIVENLKKLAGRKKRLLTVLIVAVIAVSPFLVLIHDEMSYDRNLVIENVQPVSYNSSFVTSINVSVYYCGPHTNMPIYFRILESGILYSPNGFIWNTTGDPLISHDQTKTFTLFTDQPTQFLSLGNNYIIEAYDGNLLSWLDIQWNNN